MHKNHYFFFFFALTIISLAWSKNYSSITESTDFPSYCKYAASNNKEFSKFRQSSPCVCIVETVKKDEGLAYLQSIQKNYPELLKKIASFKKNDSIGSPKRDKYDHIGKISPTTLRYIKVAGDIIKKFDSKNPLKIVEIGGGYGGQCRILFECLPIKEYIIIDLPEVLSLTKKYLDSLGVKNVKLIPYSEIPDSLSCDLLISNYAFSECNKNIQGRYLDRIIKHASHGYMTCNDLSPYSKKFSCFSKNDLKEEFKKRKIQSNFTIEIPQTHKSNYLVIW